jgi:hypothetical protein
MITAKSTLGGYFHIGSSCYFTVEGPRKAVAAPKDRTWDELPYFRLTYQRSNEEYQSFLLELAKWKSTTVIKESRINFALLNFTVENLNGFEFEKLTEEFLDTRNYDLLARSTWLKKTSQGWSMKEEVFFIDFYRCPHDRFLLERTRT